MNENPFKSPRDEPLRKGRRPEVVFNSAAVLCPLLLWVLHLFLPVLQRTPDQPGWAQVYFIFLPIGWLVILTHLLFLSTLALLGLRQWETATGLAATTIFLGLLIRAGPYSLVGTQCLYAAYAVAFAFSVAGWIRSRRQSLSS